MENLNHISNKTSAVSSRFSMNNICVSYGSHNILKNISFDTSQQQTSAQNGMVIGLLGSNGSGKTTLLRAICNELAHTGSCYLSGARLENFSVRELAKRISYIPQRSGIHISMPVLDVVLMGYNPQLHLLEHPNKTMIKNAVSALNTVGIAHLQNHDYLSLSEGEKQLCILARTMIEHTELLLLDEPDSALDFHNKYCMMKIIKKLVQDNNKTAILCLHDPVLALSYCDQLILLKDGSISDILYPVTDNVADMETAFSKLYDSVSLREYTEENGKRRLLLLSDL